jgi:hypothetical protein
MLAQSCDSNEDPVSYFTHAMTPSGSEGNPYTLNCSQENIVADQGQQFVLVRMREYYSSQWECPPQLDSCSGGYSITLGISGVGGLFSASASYPSAPPTVGPDCVELYVTPGENEGPTVIECTARHVFNISQYTAQGPVTLSFTALQQTADFFNPIGYQFEVDTTAVLAQRQKEAAVC